jgi:hypothetical protein
MKQQKCRLCSEEHPLGPCPSFSTPKARRPILGLFRPAQAKTVAKPIAPKQVKRVEPPVTNAVTNAVKPVTNGARDRVARWRDKNREAYNTKQRDLMRKQRAKAQ